MLLFNCFFGNKTTVNIGHGKTPFWYIYFLELINLLLQCTVFLLALCSCEKFSVTLISTLIFRIWSCSIINEHSEKEKYHFFVCMNSKYFFPNVFIIQIWKNCAIFKWLIKPYIVLVSRQIWVIYVFFGSSSCDL